MIDDRPEQLCPRRETFEHGDLEGVWRREIFVFVAPGGEAGCDVGAGGEESAGTGDDGEDGVRVSVEFGEGADRVDEEVAAEGV